SDADLLIHLSLHTAFQHGFVANEFHYRDFLHAMDAFLPDPDPLMARARESGALPALAAMTHACMRRFPDSRPIRDLDRAAYRSCPPSVARWIEQWREGTPPLSLFDLARLRFQLAPDRSVFMRKMLLPSPIPGRTLARPTPLRRILNILAAALPSPAPTGQNPL
ncbi:MAG: hypothetical protein ABI672_01450, partial [Vicinamibacteria bacterium]